MCNFCKRYLNTLISGYVNIMSIFALQCRLNFKEGWMVAILTKINSIHSHLSFRVCMYIFVQYTWCVAAVCWWQMFHETLKIGSKFEPLPCDFLQKKFFVWLFAKCGESQNGIAYSPSVCALILLLLHVWCELSML